MNVDFLLKYIKNFFNLKIFIFISIFTVFFYFLIYFSQYKHIDNGFFPKSYLDQWLSVYAYKNHIINNIYNYNFFVDKIKNFKDINNKNFLVSPFSFFFSLFFYNNNIVLSFLFFSFFNLLIFLLVLLLFQKKYKNIYIKYIFFSPAFWITFLSGNYFLFSFNFFLLSTIIEDITIFSGILIIFEYLNPLIVFLNIFWLIFTNNKKENLVISILSIIGFLVFINSFFSPIFIKNYIIQYVPHIINIYQNSTNSKYFIPGNMSVFNFFFQFKINKMYDYAIQFFVGITLLFLSYFMTRKKIIIFIYLLNVVLLIAPILPDYTLMLNSFSILLLLEYKKIKINIYEKILFLILWISPIWIAVFAIYTGINTFLIFESIFIIYLLNSYLDFKNLIKIKQKLFIFSKKY